MKRKQDPLTAPHRSDKAKEKLADSYMAAFNAIIAGTLFSILFNLVRLLVNALFGGRPIDFGWFIQDYTASDWLTLVFFGVVVFFSIRLASHLRSKALEIYDEIARSEARRSSRPRYTVQPHVRAPVPPRRQG